MEDLLLYDIRLQDGKLAVDTYKAEIKKEIRNGKNYVYYKYTPLDTVFPEDLSTYIIFLRDNHYFSRLSLQPIMSERDNGIFRKFQYEEATKNILLRFKLMLLSRKNKILEMVYDPYGVYEGLNSLNTMITYVDMETGIVKTMDLENLGLVDDEKIRNLEERGFIDIDDSLYKKLDSFTRK